MSHSQCIWHTYYKSECKFFLKKKEEKEEGKGKGRGIVGVEGDEGRERRKAEIFQRSKKRY